MSLTKQHCPLNPPSLQDNTATIDRLAKHLRRETGAWPQTPLGLLNDFARVIRSAGHVVTATLAATSAGPVLVAVEPGDTRGVPPQPEWGERAGLLPKKLWGSDGLGVALDIGSTHLQASLHDLADGRELARGTRQNPGTAVGADILTRIHAAAS
ncbi:MAG: hypothetical protein LDL07_05290, partial [Desulfarculus sp.]|nr:hypothetical protein [Desulfarculus sp.]